MSKKVKCGICETILDGEDCQLMAVVVDEEGKEMKVCCHHIMETKK
jgi:hypothetical protein